ncbi:MAG: GNAT family N-acetyltransferase [Rhodobacteraceae bacterium]|nr:GNAT family N-acetyltransferase [Paracoccaceae bacterium]
MAALTIRRLEAIGEVPAVDWDSCACPETSHGRAEDPFTTHRFLSALEQSGSVGKGSGWVPCHLIAEDGDRMVGVMPLYLKFHSQGEYIFDHHWAEAYERAGGRYYPKLQSAVPFTPVTGRRLLTAPAAPEGTRTALLASAVEIAAQAGLSSLHLTFCTQIEVEIGTKVGLLPRLSQQFHWHNQGYQSFDDFLGQLASRKRKAIRKERAQAQSFGGSIRRLTGENIHAGHWDDFWAFYQDTGARKWGRPYLTRSFFDLLHQTMRDDILLVLAERDGRLIAGALNFIGRDALYGRYWGAIEDHPGLHFECCYHQAIEHAIAEGLARIEAGAQGEHKLARGYLPAQTHSLHWIADKNFRKAVADYLDAERSAMGEEIEILTSYGPFRRSAAPE